MNGDFIKRYWFLTALLCLIPVGLWAPGPGLYVKEQGHIIPVFVGLMLGLSGFSMDTSSLVRQVFNWRVIVAVLTSTFVLAPVAAYGLAHWLRPEGDPHFLSAMMIMAAQAGTLASALALTMMAGGNRELALMVTVLSNSLTVLLTPFILERAVGATVQFNTSAMVLRMFLMVLLPILIGQLLRPKLWDRTQSIRPALRIMPQLIILLFVYAGFASGADTLRQGGELLVRFLVACIALHAILLSAMAVVSGILKLSWPDRTAVILCGSQKTLPNGVYIWIHFFPTNPYGAVPLVLYHLFQLIVDTLLVSKFEKLNGMKKVDKY